jgi:hypothetical protein
VKVTHTLHLTGQMTGNSKAFEVWVVCFWQAHSPSQFWRCFLELFRPLPLHQKEVVRE